MKKLFQYKFSILWSLLILFLCSIPSNDIPHVGFLNIPHFDKVVHFVFFLVLQTLLVLETYVENPVNTVFWILTLTVCLLFGISIELLQGYVFISRSMNVFDFVADALGTFLALPFSLYVAIPLFNKLFRK